MAQEISIEDAFPTFQRRVRELFEENLVLRAQVDVLERKFAAAQQDAPVLAGPDLAAQPPYPKDERG
ncbi:hypothetical protein ACIRQH_35055 [Streptomyces sp. NPDC102279]|uniref:hypothetical protein n=1 Tax=Streptomyces sp. NPDC102279 TaxID=3366153 RepID=UPI0037F41467